MYFCDNKDIARAVRMLEQLRGHGMLVGVTGTGRSSVATLAAHIVGASLKRIILIIIICIYFLIG